MTTDQQGWVGIDLGATKVLVTYFGPDWSVLAEIKAETPRDDGPEAIVARTGEVVSDLLGPDRAKALGVGIGFAGLVDWRVGTVRSSIMLPGWDDFPLADRLSAHLGLPVLADNDATVAGYGEFVALGSPPELNLLLLTVGTGIGGAIILGGQVYRGATGTAGEFGNMSIDWRGVECWCGSRGCLNMLASGTAIADGTAFHRTEDVAEAAIAGDARARSAVEQAADALGAGVANLINAFNPDRIALSGGVTALGADFLDRVRRSAASRAFAEPFAHVQIDYTRAGVRVGTLGAAALAAAHFGGVDG